MVWRGIFAGALLLVALGIHATAAETPVSGSASQGKSLFEQKCTTCHTIGGGNKVGPDLQGVTQQRPRDWLVKFISNPPKMIASGDPTANQLKNQFGVEMPDLRLPPEEVSSLIAYLASTGTAAQVPPQQPEKTAAAPTQVVPPAQKPSAAGSPDEGRKLFAGIIPLHNGGPPCISCHSINGIPFPGGGSLGPDLTGVYKRLGAAGTASILATLPFPTMAPIFGKHPLSPTEQQDVAAFLAQAPGQPSTGGFWPALLGGVILTALTLILFQILWRNRLRKVREPLAEKG